MTDNAREKEARLTADSWAEELRDVVALARRRLADAYPPTRYFHEDEDPIRLALFAEAQALALVSIADSLAELAAQGRGESSGGVSGSGWPQPVDPWEQSA